MTAEKSDQVIICPNCQKKIPLTEAISHQIREKLHKEFEVEFKKKEQVRTKKFQNQ